MAKQVIGATVEVEFQSVGNLRKAIKDANSELLKTQAAFGAASKEAIEVAKRVAMLKDSLKEASETADLFDPGNKFKAVGNAVTALAHGFTAVQGAMGLLGVESKEVEKQLLKVQSALALSQGLSGLLDSGKDFARLGSIIKTQVVTAFSTLRGAIIATGVGALAVGLGLLIANFDKVKNAVLNLFPGLGKLASFLGDIFESFTDFIGITSKAERQLESFTKAVAKSNDTIDSQIKILESQGGREDKIYELKKKRVENDLNVLRESLKVKKELSEEELKQFRDLKVQQIVLDNEEKRRIADINKKAAEEAKKKAEERSKESKEAREKREKEREDDFQKDQEQRRKQNDAEIDNLRELTRRKEELEKEQEEKKKAAEELAVERQNAAIEQVIAQRDRLIKKQDEELALDQQRTAAKLQLQDSIISGLGVLADVFGRQTALGKTLAVAEIALGTAKGFIQGLDIAQKSAAGTGPGAAFAFPIFYATQIAAVLSAANRARQALAKVPGSGSSGGSISAPKISTGAPLQAALSPQAQGQALNAAAINNLQGNPTRAYILDRDIQNQNQVNAFITRNANI